MFFLVYFSLVLQAISSAKYVEMCSKFTSLTETKDAINEEMYWFTFLLKQKKLKIRHTDIKQSSLCQSKCYKLHLDCNKYELYYCSKSESLGFLSWAPHTYRFVLNGINCKFRFKLILDLFSGTIIFLDWILTKC